MTQDRRGAILPLTRRTIIANGSGFKAQAQLYCGLIVFTQNLPIMHDRPTKDV